MRWHAIIGTIFLIGCSSTEIAYNERPFEEIYKSATSLLDKESYEKAANEFDEIERQHPYATCAPKAQLMSAYCAFKAQKFERAISTLDIFISLHPSSQFIAYAYYLRAFCYYTQMVSAHRDKENAELALQAFDEVARRFSSTDYAQEAKLKIDFLKEHLASQEIYIGKNYLQEKQYIAALKRLTNLVKDYPTSILMPEALYRTIECQVALDLSLGAKKTLVMLQHNFPKDRWTVKACELFNRYFKLPLNEQKMPPSKSK